MVETVLQTFLIQSHPKSCDSFGQRHGSTALKSNWLMKQTEQKNTIENEIGPGQSLRSMALANRIAALDTKLFPLYLPAYIFHKIN